MRHYVDGYNLLFSLYDEEEKGLQNQREECLDLIRELIDHSSIEVTVVFDARFAPASHRYQSGNVEVAYTDEATNADDWIVEHLDYRREQSIVVTNDRHLGRRCRALGAKVQTPHGWLSSLQKKKRDKKQIRSQPIEISFSAKKNHPLKKPPPSSKISPDDPNFLERQPGENEMDRWRRIFETDTKKNDL